VGTTGIPRNLLFSPANVHDVNLLEPLLEYEQDKTVVCDKGYIGHEQAAAVAVNNNEIVTEKRKNQIGHEEHNKAIHPLMKRRKVVECIISHLERLHSKTMKQRSFWTLKARMIAKCIAIGTAIVYNIENGFEKLLCMKILHPEFL
jgi:IS5 family transposase